MARLGSSKAVALGVALAMSGLLANCIGTIGDDGVEGQAVDSALVPQGGLRRLSASEMGYTLRDLLGDETLPIFETLPVDARTPFDNDYTEQVASQGLIDAADFLAQHAIENLLADPARRDAIVGCTPSGADDEACLRSFITSFGRRALRRPLAAEEIDAYVARALPFAVEASDFYTAVDTVLWALLQDPEFLYRPEIGTPVDGQPGVYRLTDFEIAARLSYFLWGSGPDDALLDQAAAGMLSTPEQRREITTALLQDEHAKKRMLRFHAMWLGFEILPYAGQLADDMRSETSALIDRVIFQDNRPWQDLLRFEETFVTDFLADHYGLPAPADPAGDWVSYGDSGRAGLLSQGSFLSIGAKFNDTSPVRRGLVVR